MHGLSAAAELKCIMGYQRLRTSLRTDEITGAKARAQTSARRMRRVKLPANTPQTRKRKATGELGAPGNQVMWAELSVYLAGVVDLDHAPGR